MDEVTGMFNAGPLHTTTVAAAVTEGAAPMVAVAVILFP
jgi:hypothetical protein